jgi:ABC-type proline/glycine betaine transport system permease subunit
MLVAAEMMGTSSGLGWFVVQSQEAYNARRIFAGAAVITAMGLATDLVLEHLESWFVRWNPTPDARRALVSGGVAVNRKRLVSPAGGCPIG